VAWGHQEAGFDHDETGRFLCFGWDSAPMVNSHPILQYLITVPIEAVALYAIGNPKGGPEVQKWAIGVIGTLVGFWLRGQ
jgi:hypothetical protein